MIAREPMLQSRIYRRVPFVRLSEQDVLELLPSYHAIYDGVDPELLAVIDSHASAGRLRAVAAAPSTGLTLCQAAGNPRITRPIAEAAMAQLGALT